MRDEQRSLDEEGLQESRRGEATQWVTAIIAALLVCAAIMFAK